MKRKIIPEQDPTIQEAHAIDSFLRGRGHIAYTTRDYVALLCCFSKESNRHDESVKPEHALYGFVYFGSGRHEAKFVRESAAESIAMARGNGNEVSFLERTEDLVDLLKHL